MIEIRKEDYKFTDLKNHSQIFLKDDDESIYTNPYYVHDIRMTGAQHVLNLVSKAVFYPRWS